MEVLIFGAVSLVFSIAFWAFTVLPLLISYHIGRAIDRSYHLAFMKWLVPASLILLICIWVGSSYYFFRQECQTITPMRGDVTTSMRPQGFRFYVDESVAPHGGIRFEHAVRNGFISYVESKPYNYKICAGKVLRENPRIVSVERGGDCQGLDAAGSLPEVHFLPKKKVSYWWAPPIYRAEIRVTDSTTGAILASATDLLIGGGILGTYQRAIGGDQDYEYLSCGFAHSKPGPWRPSLTSRPEFEQYEVADTLLVARALASK